MQEKHEEVVAIADFSATLMQESQENATNSSENPIKYLDFKRNDVILRVCSYENGWCYGSLSGNPENCGFFPSNYVKTREISQEISEEKPAEPAKSPKKRKADGNWLDFMQEILQNDEKSASFPKESSEIARNLSENDVFNESLVQKNYNSIIGYKKIKISSDPTQPLKKRPQFAVGNGTPAPVLNNEFAMIPVKQQDPNSKAIRLLYHYFDYDKWIDEKNSGRHAKKAKPDASRKKPKKKVLNLKL